MEFLENYVKRFNNDLIPLFLHKNNNVEFYKNIEKYQNYEKEKIILLVKPNQNSEFDKQFILNNFMENRNEFNKGNEFSNDNNVTNQKNNNWNCKKFAKEFGK